MSHCNYLDSRKSSIKEDRAAPANQLEVLLLLLQSCCQFPLLHIEFFCLFGIVTVDLKAAVTPVD